MDSCHHMIPSVILVNKVPSFVKLLTAIIKIDVIQEELSVVLNRKTVDSERQYRIDPIPSSCGYPQSIHPFHQEN